MTRYINTGGGRVSLFGEVYNVLGAVNVRGVSKDAFINGRRVSIVTKEFNQWPPAAHRRTDLGILRTRAKR